MKAKMLALWLLTGSLSLSATNLDTKEEIDDFSISLSAAKISTIEPKMKIGVWFACANDVFKYHEMDPYKKAEAAEAALDVYMNKAKSLNFGSRIGEEVTTTTTYHFGAYDILIGGHKIMNFGNGYVVERRTNRLSQLTVAFDGIKEGVDDVFLVSAGESKQIFAIKEPETDDWSEKVRQKMDQRNNPVMASIKIKGTIAKIEENHFEDMKRSNCYPLMTKIRIKVKHIDVYNSKTNELLFSKDM